MIQGLSLAEIQHLIQSLPVEWGEVDVSHADRFEMMLREPFMIRGRKDPYPTLEKKAALFFYLLLKHANTCLATVVLLIFLAKNHSWLRVNSHEFAPFALWIQQSPEMMKEQTVAAVEVFLEKYMVLI